MNLSKLTVPIFVILNVIFFVETAGLKGMFQINTTKCFDGIGCFGIGGHFYHPIYRPISLLPTDRKNIDITFRLYTRRTIPEFVLIKEDIDLKLWKDIFDARARTKVICHGFISDPDQEWVQKLMESLLRYDDVNVIAVDWRKGAQMPYSQAVANARVAGAEVSSLISYLKNVTGIELNLFHLIGFSLGAHVAGYAGKRLNKVARITGLDPAGPYFDNMSKEARLDRSDADFVDVIHTDRGKILLFGQGTDDAIGHIDFYPNNGYDQPGCKKDIASTLLNFKIETASESISCNHHMAPEFFTETLIYHDCLPVGFACANWDAFLEGKCTDCGIDGKSCAILGIDAEEYAPLKENRSIKFYLKTGDKSPYCQFHYQITVTVHNTKEGRSGSGKLHLTLFGDSGTVSSQLSRKSQEFKSGNVYTYLIANSTDLGMVQSGVLKFTPSIKLFLHSPIIYVKHVKVTFINHNRGGHFCILHVNDDQPLSPYQDVLLSPSFNCYSGIDERSSKIVKSTRTSPKNK